MNEHSGYSYRIPSIINQKSLIPIFIFVRIRYWKHIELYFLHRSTNKVSKTSISHTKSIDKYSTTNKKLNVIKYCIEIVHFRKSHKIHWLKFGPVHEMNWSVQWNIKLKYVFLVAACFQTKILCTNQITKPPNGEIFHCNHVTQS